MTSSRHRSTAFLVVVALVFIVLSYASLAASQRDSGSWASSDTSFSSRGSSSNGVAVTSFVKHGGGAGRKASSDGENDEGGDVAARGDASTAKTIAQRIDEALEQEFPEDKKKESVGKTYTEKAKQEDVSLRGREREERGGEIDGKRSMEPGSQLVFLNKKNSPLSLSLPPTYQPT